MINTAFALKEFSFEGEMIATTELNPACHISFYLHKDGDLKGIKAVNRYSPRNS